MIAEDLAVFHVNNAVGVGFKALVVGHADDRGAMFFSGAVQEFDNDLAIF